MPYESLSDLLAHQDASKGNAAFASSPVPTDRSLSTAKMVALVCSILGATLVWAVEYGYGSNYLLALGMTKQASSLVWLAGPVSGLIAQPMIGALSDQATGPFRRRRFIVWSTVAVCVSALFAAYCRGISAFFVPLLAPSEGDWDPRLAGWIQATALWIAVPAFWMLDFALNALQATSRALILDTATGPQQATVNAWQGRVATVGNLLGFGLGFTDLGHSRALAWLPGGQTAHLFVVAIVLCAFFTFVTCYFIDEVPENPFFEASPDQRRNVWVLLKNIRTNLVELPYPVRHVCYAQFFSWIGWFPFLFYATVYIAEQSQAHLGRSRQQAERDGSLAMLCYALVGLATGIVLPMLYQFSSSQWLIHSGSRYGWLRAVFQRMTLVHLWAGSCFFFALCMFSTFLVTSLHGSFAAVALVGIPNAITFWIPYALVCEMVIEAEAAEAAQASVRSGKRRQVERALTECEPLVGRRSTKMPSGATILGIHNLAIVVPQLITSVLASAIFKVVELTAPAAEAGSGRRWDVEWVFGLGGLAALVATYMVTQVPPTQTEQALVDGLARPDGGETGEQGTV